MSYINVHTAYPELKNKVVIVTGGSSGIGLATVQLFRQNEAKVVVADLVPPPVDQKFPLDPAGLHYCQTDVSSWSSLRNLFTQTFDHYGRIDVVFANAGINEKEDIFLDKFDPEGQLQEPNYQVLDINLKSVLSTSKLATHYFAKNSPAGGKLIITGSFAAYFGEPIPVYTASKHGVLGLMRSIRNPAPNFNVTVNVVTPWIVNTSWLTPALHKLMDAHGIPITDTKNVARAVAYLATSDWNGKSLYVAGDKFIELECGIDETRKEWLGQEFSELAAESSGYAGELRGKSGW